MRVGRVVAVEDFPEARKPAWKHDHRLSGPSSGSSRSSASVTTTRVTSSRAPWWWPVKSLPATQIGPVRSGCWSWELSTNERGRRAAAPRPGAPAGLGDRLTG